MVQVASSRLLHPLHYFSTELCDSPAFFLELQTDEVQPLHPHPRFQQHLKCPRCHFLPLFACLVHIPSLFLCTPFLFACVSLRVDFYGRVSGRTRPVGVPQEQLPFKTPEDGLEVDTCMK